MLSTRSRLQVLEALAEYEQPDTTLVQNDCSPDKNEDKEREVMKRRRKKIIKEILDTEETYQNCLSLIINYFQKPFQEARILPPAALATIFSNIDLIMDVNNELLNQLETTSIGQAFLYLAPFLKMYATYANNHERALATLIEWEQKKPEYAAFRRKQEELPEVCGLKFNALLITPVQRVPRYKLLLDDLLNNTPEEHPDHDAIKEAASQISQVASYINEHIREHENFQKMLTIQNQLTGATAPKILAPGRRFIKEGILKKVSRRGGTAHERMFFLFSDMLMYAKTSASAKYSCCCVLPLNHCQVERMLGDLFKITCKSESLLLYSEDTKTVSIWIEELESAIGKFKQCRRTLHKESSAKEPLRRPALLRHRKQEKRKFSQIQEEETSDGTFLTENTTQNESLCNSPIPRKPWKRCKQMHSSANAASPSEQKILCVTPKSLKRKHQKLSVPNTEDDTGQVNEGFNISQVETCASEGMSPIQTQAPLHLNKTVDSMEIIDKFELSTESDNVFDNDTTDTESDLQTVKEIRDQDNFSTEQGHLPQRIPSNLETTASASQRPRSLFKTPGWFRSNQVHPTNLPTQEQGSSCVVQ